MRAPSRGFPILTFHRVNDDDDPFLPSMPTAVFAARMAHIARHYRVLAVEDLVERVRQGTAPRNALALTFDDGYRDNLSHAAPILAQHGLPATIFLATGYIGTPDVPWFDRRRPRLQALPPKRPRAPRPPASRARRLKETGSPPSISRWAGSRLCPTTSAARRSSSW